MLHFRQFLRTVSKSETQTDDARPGTGSGNSNSSSNSSNSSNSDGVLQKGQQRTDVQQVQVKVIVEKQFSCGEDADTEVFSLCPLDDGNVLVSYAQRGWSKNAPSEKFDRKGQSLFTQEKVTGKASFTSIGNGRVRHILPAEGSTRTYCKSRASAVHFKLSHNNNNNHNNHGQGKAEVTKVNVISAVPFKAELTTEFSIKLGGPHRAFDVDASEQLFVVVVEEVEEDEEEADEQVEPEGSERQRSVKLYRRPDEDAVATYTPPTAAFQPSDVCFFGTGSQQELVVANERNDCIHVVSVSRDGRALSFLHYLAPSCPMLLQPTALNTDRQGRLWVACRGGNVFTIRMTPMS